MRKKSQICWIAAVMLVLLALAVMPRNVAAQSIAEFYQGKTIDMIIGYPTGGANDVYARAVARHIGRHIPGNPRSIARNMPGAGSLLAANHIYNVAPKDGTVLGLVAATIPLDEKLGTAGVKFESGKFNWIGRVASAINATMIWHTSPLNTIEDAFKMEASLGASGTGSTVFIYPNVLNNVVGTKFKLVMGYKGSNDAMLAMERGEVEGHTTSWEGIKSGRSDWLRDKKIRLIVQYGLNRHPDLPDVPTVLEIARTAEQREILTAVVNATEIGKAVLAGPGLPAERVTALRRAFDGMVNDPEFRAELAGHRVDLTPMSGEPLQKLVRDLGSLSPALLEKLRAVYGSEGAK